MISDVHLDIYLRYVVQLLFTFQVILFKMPVFHHHETA